MRQLAPGLATLAWALAALAPAAFAEAGLPDWLVTHLLGAFDLIREGSFAVVSDDVQLLTGRPPRTLEAFVRDHAAAFRR